MEHLDNDRNYFELLKQCGYCVRPLFFFVCFELTIMLALEENPINHWWLINNISPYLYKEYDTFKWESSLFGLNFNHPVVPESALWNESTMDRPMLYIGSLFTAIGKCEWQFLFLIKIAIVFLSDFQRNNSFQRWRDLVRIRWFKCTTWWRIVWQSLRRYHFLIRSL